MNSNRVKSIEAAKSIEINQRVYEKRRLGHNVTVLSLGEAYFDIPDFGFETIEHEVGYHYCDSQGLPELRKKIVDYYNYNNQIETLSSSNILISAGSKILTMNTMLSILDKGDEVLLHEPAWLSYEDQAKLCDARATYIPYDKELCEFESYFTKKTKLIVINNPNNPSGKIYNAEQLRLLISIAKSREIFVLVDEAYSDFVSQEEGFNTCTSLIEEFDNLCVVNSMSKNFGMSGWRIGYAVSNSKFIRTLTVLNQHTITCAPTVLQIYFSKYFKEIYYCCQEQLAKLIAKRRKVTEILINKNILFLPGSATFYFFLDLNQSLYTGDELSRLLLEEHDIATVPGSSYGETTSNFVRISIGTENLKTIELALDVISEYVNNG
ncbi:pyridoxal phosphate-dependent aminotransferase [Vibrio sp. 99-8-1]|uniref:pyridoxal phosphate-dependent aminotransferase n=1 Tax=Vibrio sp. 99-8-1 TaxID=2607602 RepID=UPI0014936E35|nr:pyridoxal phosphate-dependent aminotransferase [Vibrio sp. 99-8-1]NOI68717.1 pyridoxal phosphate-dependent aminotransferase [Vibrio sp. 99-8-1]